MALINRNVEGSIVLANSSINSNNGRLIVMLALITLAIISSSCSNQSKQESSTVSEEVQYAPDKALFEVAGKVKEITDITNPVLPIHTHAGEVIEFSKDGKWDNYSQAGGDEYKVTIRRNENNQITKIDGTNLDYSWSVGYEWEGDRVSKEIFNGLEGGVSTILTYENGKLKTISLQEYDMGDKVVYAYTLIDEKVDNIGNWIERNWQKKMETYSFQADINGYISTPDFTTTEDITEKRTIIYYE